MTRSLTGWLLLAVFLSPCAGQAQPPKNKTTAPPSAQDDPSDLDLVEGLLNARRDYQLALEKLRAHYVQVNEAEKSRWAEEELLHFHRHSKPAYNLKKDVPPATLQATTNRPEANELYRRAIGYKDKGYGIEYTDNQHRAEILFQQILSSYPDSDKIGDVGYQLGDLYESKAYKHYRRAAVYFERSLQWSPNTRSDARMRAARLYDRNLADRARALELYREIISSEVNEQRRAEAERRITELTGGTRP